jgi:hypothetical protein
VIAFNRKRRENMSMIMSMDTMKERATLNTGRRRRGKG